MMITIWKKDRTGKLRNRENTEYFHIAISYINFLHKFPGINLINYFSLAIQIKLTLTPLSFLQVLKLFTCIHFCIFSRKNSAVLSNSNWNNITATISPNVWIVLCVSKRYCTIPGFFIYLFSALPPLYSQIIFIITTTLGLLRVWYKMDGYINEINK